MVTPRSLLLLYLAAIIGIVCATVEDTGNEVELPKKIELIEGVSLKFPETNNTGKIMSFEVGTQGEHDEGHTSNCSLLVMQDDQERISDTTSRKKKKKMIEKFLPLFIMPFLIQSSIVPLFLGMLKFMLFKSLMVGKFALALILFNAFKNQNSSKGRDTEIADVHYGYHSGHGMEEYGAYIN